jgi:hypothetical protein
MYTVLDAEGGEEKNANFGGREWYDLFSDLWPYASAPF